MVPPRSTARCKALALSNPSASGEKPKSAASVKPWPDTRPGMAFDDAGADCACASVVAAAKSISNKFQHRFIVGNFQRSMVVSLDQVKLANEKWWYSLKLNGVPRMPAWTYIPCVAKNRKPHLKNDNESFSGRR
jgi:hypothetical protein